MEPTTSVPTSTVSTLEAPVSLFKSSWNFLVQHWGTIIPIMILPSVVGLIGNVLAYTHNTALSIIAMLLAISSFIATIASFPASVSAVHRLYSGDTAVTLSGQYKIGFTWFWSFLLVAIISGLVTIGSFALLIVPGVIVGVYTSLYLFTLIIDGNRGFSALTESFALVRGRFWPVLGRLLFLMLVVIIIQLIFTGIGFVSGLSVALKAAMIAGSTGAQAPLGTFVLSGILSLIANSIIMPVSLAYTYRLYQSLKATRGATEGVIAFKRWLVAFICVGIIAITLIPIVAILSIGAAIGRAREQGAQLQQQQINLQKQLDAIQKLNSTTTNSYQPYSDSAGTLQGNRPGGAGN